MDIARFASNTLTPQVEIRLKDGIDINSVTIHPVLFYPQEVIEVSADKKTVRFTMDDRLPYAIVAVNGGDPQDAITNGPQLVLINDPLEKAERKPSPDAPNVLDFKAFAQDYLAAHPNADRVGEICRPAGTVTDASLNNGKMYTWNYDEGHFVPYTDKIVAFPDKRARNANDLSDALQAALEK